MAGQDLDMPLRKEHRRICGFYFFIKRTHSPTVINHNWNVEHKRASQTLLLQDRVDSYTLDYLKWGTMCTCQHVYRCSRVPKKEKKIIGGPMPYLVEPLKQWMSRLWGRQFGFYKLIMCGLMLVLCHMDAPWVLVSFRLLKKSVMIQERLCVLTGLGSDYTQVVKRVACLICDQVEAAFLMRVLLLYRHVFLFCFFYIWLKNL